jgi:NADH-quinone oxidoreductase subunit C
LSVEAVQELAKESGGTLSSIKNATVITVRPDQIPYVCGRVAKIPGFYHLTTITAMDLGDSIAVLYSFWKGKTFLVVKALVPKTSLHVPSLAAILPSAVLYEAEVKDMLGVVFDGNPFMKTNLLLPDEYPKNAPPPLRKEADPAKIRKMLGLE